MRPAAAEKNGRQHGRRSSRIFVVDDNKLQAQSLGQCSMGVMRFDFMTAGALAAGIRLMLRLSISVARHQWLRGRTPNREQPQWRHMTLIAQTGWGRDSDRDSSGQAGFDHHFTKPLNHEALEKVIDQSAAQTVDASMDFVEIHRGDPTSPMKSS
jgi:hypothetical protein